MVFPPETTTRKRHSVANAPRAFRTGRINRHVCHAHWNSDHVAILNFPSLKVASGEIQTTRELRRRLRRDEHLQTITGPTGAGLVLDCVGVQSTLDLGAKLLGRNSVWTIVGLGGGRHEFRHGSTPYGTSMSIPYSGSRAELMEVIAMARDGRIHAEISEFPLTEAVDVYATLKAGKITGRAVLVPS